MPHPVDLNTDLLRLEVDDEGIATIWLDDPEASANKISWATLDGFSEVLGHLEELDALTGVVLISAKDHSFVVGADLEMINAFETANDVRGLTRRAHRLLSRTKSIDVPTVAAIGGPCMGGGLELTLGCDYRIASTHDSTRLALPEVKLGLMPGGGGTQYLPRLVGVQQALTMMLTGKNVYPKKARDTGLVDTLIHPPGLHEAAKRAARQLASGTVSVDRDHQSFGSRLLESNTLSRRVIYRQAANRTKKRTRGNYPAPPRIIETVRTGMEKNLDAGLDAEMNHFSDLVFTPEAAALVELFFAKQNAEDHPHPNRAAHVRSLGILGAGLMGGGIAEVSAANDVDVILKDQTLELAAQGKKQVWSAMNRKKEKGILNRFERDQAAERVVATASYDLMTHCDFVIEAVPEDLELKQQVLSDVEETVAKDTVIATNTSSIPVARIAEALDRPERVLGMHYFSPVADVPLVELITTEETSDEALATAYELALTQDKTVIVVNDGPGFYTTRILSLYMNEALLLLEEGADVPTVDEYMKDYGFPMGPFELFDFVGMDVASKISDVMSEHLPVDRDDISDAASGLVEADLLGRKRNIGFYHYGPDEDGEGKERKDLNEDIYRYLDQTSRSTPSRQIVQDRLALMMINEAVRCLEDDVLRSATDGDLGAVFGLGFPPFLGGPFRHIDRQGADRITKRMEDLSHQYGARFDPADLLVEHANDGRTFHS